MAGFKGMDAIKGAIENYATGGMLNYFTLKDDGDKAEARMLHKDDNDLDCTLVHQLEIGGKKKYVECLKVYEKPCALCEQMLKPTLKMFISMLVLRVLEHETKGGKKVGEWKDVNKVQVWERGRDQMNRMLNLINKKGDLRKHTYEILRNGKAGDTSTSYDIDPFDDHKHAAEVGPDDLPVRDSIYDNLVMQVPYEQMKELLKGGAAAPVKKEGAIGGKGGDKDDDLPF